MFAIGAETGILETMTGLDREEQAQYVITIGADDGSAALSTAVITINVLDVNDNAPMFVSPALFFVSEAAPMGTLVSTLVAQDGDAGTNGTVAYNYEPTSLHQDTFHLFGNGTLIVADPSSFDAESTVTEYTGMYTDCHSRMGAFYHQPQHCQQFTLLFIFIVKCSME